MKKFKVVMEAMTKLPNYYVNVFCPVDASNWLPQRRKRLILIGTKRPYSIIAPTQQNNRPSLKSLLEENPEVEMPDYSFQQRLLSSQCVGRDVACFGAMLILR